MLKKQPNTGATANNTCPAKSQPNGTNGTPNGGATTNGTNGAANGKVNGQSRSKVTNGVENGRSKIDAVKVDTSKAQKKFSQVSTLFYDASPASMDVLLSEHHSIRNAHRILAKRETARSATSRSTKLKKSRQKSNATTSSASDAKNVAGS